jgi:Tat protein translocase TatC
VLIASPVIFWQIWKFVAPGLYKHEKRLLLPFSFLSALCFIGGAAFGYFVVFPPAFRFLLGYSADFLTPMPVVKEYFSLSLRLLIAFGVVFELPILMVFLAKLGIVDVPGQAWHCGCAVSQQEQKICNSDKFYYCRSAYTHSGYCQPDAHGCASSGSV